MSEGNGSAVTEVTRVAADEVTPELLFNELRTLRSEFEAKLAPVPTMARQLLEVVKYLKALSQKLDHVADVNSKNGKALDILLQRTEVDGA